MADYLIKIKGGFSTSVFYNNVLKELHKCLVEDNQNRVIFDFSMTTYIDALVIPNLLCVGYILREETKQIPLITTLNTDIYTSKSNIMQYLNDIGFIEHAYKLKLFEFYNPELKPKSNMIPEYCATFFFNNDKKSKEDIASEISNRSYKLFNKHLKNYFDEDAIFGYGNIFAKFAAELCNNSSIHGNSFSFMTIQSNIKLQIVSIAVSDCGCGFYESLSKKIESGKLDKQELITIDKNTFINVKSENIALYSILESTFYRYFDKAYGIWDIARTVLKKSGVIRIHSSDSRIILTPNKFPLVLDLCKNANELKAVLLEEFINKKDYNYFTDLKYNGVHFEIEMPMSTVSGVRI